MSTNNINNPIYTLPFDYGFTREVVERKTLSRDGPKFDVYYYTPNTQKLSSFRDVEQCLGSLPLKIENFTFQEAPIGVGAPKEICRKDYEYAPKENLTIQQMIHISYPYMIEAIEEYVIRLRENPNNEPSLDVRAIMDKAIEEYMKK